MGLDNSGQLSTGRNQYSLFLGLDNPFDINDQISLSMNGDAEMAFSNGHQRSHSLNAFYSVPYGY